MAKARTPRNPLRQVRSFFEKNWVYFLTFLGYFLASGWTQTYFGAPLMTPDAVGYLRYSQEPWKLFGNWHPPGVSFLLYLGSKTGLNPFHTIQIVSASLCLTLFCFLEKKTNRLWAFFWSAFFFLDASWLLLRMSLMSEAPFILFLTLLGIVSVPSRLSKPVRFIFAMIFFVIANQFRVIGFAVLPAVIAAMGYEKKGKRWNWNWKNALGATTVILLSWMIINILTLGSPVRSLNLQDRASSCASFLRSFTPFPYCNWKPDLPICALDPQHQFIGNVALATDDGLLAQAYNAESPTSKFALVEPEEICRTQKQVLGLVLTHAPFHFIKLIASRIWSQYGPWYWDEQSYPQEGAVPPEHTWLLGDYLRHFQHPQYFIQLFLVLVSIGIFVSPSYRANMAYFWLASLAHATGISIFNPFRALRYMAVSKFLIIICFICLLYEVYVLLTEHFKNEE